MGGVAGRGLGLIGPLLALGLAGCGTTPVPTPSPIKLRIPAPKVTAFTEAAPVSALALAPPHLWVGTPAGLERFVLETGEVTHLSREDGLPGERIDALAHGDGKLWVMTDGGVASLEDGGWRLAAPAPAALAASTARTAQADGDGVWIGSSAGLFRLDPAGWTKTRITAPVTQLLRDRTGALWIGTAGQGVLRLPPGGTAAAHLTPLHFGRRNGNEVSVVLGLALGSNGEVVVVGSERVAIYSPSSPSPGSSGSFSSFRPSPAVELRGIARFGSDLMLLGEERAFLIESPAKGAHELRRDGLQLVPMTPGAAQVGRRYRVRALELRVPEHARGFEGSSPTGETAGAVVIGTARTGALVIGPDLRPRAYRASKLLENAVALFVACLREDDCYLATGAHEMWHFDGKTFAADTIDPNLPESRVLAVLRSPEKRVLAIYQGSQGSDARTLNVSQRRGDHWEALSELSIEVPTGRASISFAHFAPDGLLWLGLGYREETQSEPTPFGIAIVDLSLNAVAYHHSTGGAALPGMLAFPNDVTDVAFVGQDQVWLATGSGAIRLVGSTVTMFTESDGLVSGVLHRISADPDVVFVASREGVGHYDGTTWRFPKALAVAARALALGSDGRLWLGTDKGVVAYDGRRSELMNRRRGLIEDDVLDLTVDDFGRVWARSAGVLHIIVPVPR